MAVRRDVLNLSREAQGSALETLIARISTRFINLPTDKIDAGINLGLSEIGKFAGADRCYIYLKNKDNGTAATYAWCRRETRAWIHHWQRLPVESFPWWADKLSRFDAVAISTVADLPAGARAKKEFVRSHKIKSFLAVPVEKAGTVTGFFGLDTVREEKAWPPFLLYLLKLAGEIFLNALEHKRAADIIHKRNAQLELIHRIQGEIQIDADVESVLTAAAESIGKAFGYYKISVNLYDKNTDEIVYLVGWNKTGLTIPRGHRQKLGEGLIGRAGLLRQTIVANDVAKEPGYLCFHLSQTKAELVVPLIIHDRLVGVLDLQDTHTNAFSEDDVAVLQSLGRYIAYVIDGRQKEEALLESLDKYQTIIENIQEGYYEVDLSGNFTFCNDSLCRILGYPRQKVLGLNNRQYMEEESASKIYSIFNLVYKTGKPVKCVDLEVVTGDGMKHHAEFSVSLVQDAQGQPTGFRGIVRDVTERKKSQQALLEANARLNTLLQAIPDVVYFKDAEGRNLIVNSSFEKLAGLSGEKIIGKKDDELLLPDLARYCRESDEKVVKHGKFLRFEEESAGQGGEKTYFETIKAPVFDQNGSMVGLVGVSRDITERKRAEEKIKASLQEKEVLLKEIHHRVKNNLQVISSLLNLQAYNSSDPQLLKILREGQNRIRSMALVHEKLYQSKDLSRIDFAEYIRNLAVHLFHSYQVDPGRIQLKQDIEGIFLDINAAIPCGLIMNELMSNSLKYAFPGGRSGEISLELRRQDDRRLLLVVRDNGVGLPKDLDIQKTKTLGMQIVTLLAYQLDGSLEVRRETGTEFRILFQELQRR